MTDADLQTVRDWCKANRVTVQETPLSEGIAYRLKGLVNAFHPSLATRFYAAYTEHEMYEKAWRILGPIIQSVRNLDAVEVEGPYEAEYYDDDDWRLYSNNGEYLTDLSKQNLSEQSARRITNILNRECGK